MATVQDITRYSGSQGFSQTGQVDWIKLASLAITCPLNIATRMSRAGIGEVTVVVATSACSSFNFPPEGQQELTNSLSQLQGYSTLSKTLFIGVGIKHLVNELITTEGGSLCVALSSALTILYRVPFEAARVWREVCVIQDVGGRPIPSIHEFETFVEPCAGSLRRSSLGWKFEMFASFLDANNFTTKAPTHAHELADALLKLGAISKSEAPSLVFVGGTECAWLAAVADVLLRLNIEIQSDEGMRIWRSSDHQVVRSQTVQAFFRTRHPRSLSTQALSQHVCCITDGRVLLEEQMALTDSCVQKPTSWESILSDTFPDWERMTFQPARTHFTTLLGCIARHSNEYFTTKSDFKPRDFYQWWICLSPLEPLYAPNACGDKLVAFARKNLPELPLPDSINMTDEVKAADLHIQIEASIDGLMEACQCISCSSKPRSNERTCLKRLALTLIRYLLILSPITVSPHIAPAISSLRRLYHRTLSNGDADIVSLPTSRLALVLFMFSGRLPTQRIPEDLSAISFGGVCVFLKMLREMTSSPVDAVDIIVIPGNIRHQDGFYAFLKDTFELRCLQRQGTRNPNLHGYRLDLFVEEQEERSTLGAFYKGTCSGKDDFWIQPTEMHRLLMRLVSIDPHPDDPVQICERDAIIYAKDCAWSYNDNSLQRSLGSYCRSRTTSDSIWSTLLWNAWDSSFHEKTQQLSIDVSTFAWPGPLNLVGNTEMLGEDVENYLYGHGTRMRIMRFSGCPRCLVQLVASAWANADDSYQPSLPNMGPGKKQGTITLRYSANDNDVEQILFDLEPITKRKASQDNQGVRGGFFSNRVSARFKSKSYD